MRRRHRSPVSTRAGRRRKTLKATEESQNDPEFIVSSCDEDYVPSSDSDSGCSDEEFGSEKPLKNTIENEEKRLEDLNLDGQNGIHEASDILHSSGDNLREPDAPLLLRNRRRNRQKKHKDAPPLMWEILESQNEQWIDDHEGDADDLDSFDEKYSEIAEQPPDIVIPLLRFQKEWLAWALKQEQSENNGGILADEMGMGKTIQAISLVLAARSYSKEFGFYQDSQSTSVALPKVQCTLVICPLVAIRQWVNEILRFTKAESAKVLVYHGAKRSICPEEFSKCDFVLTTYSTIEVDYRKNVMPPKDRCPWCQKLFYPRKMATHLKYFCGPHAMKTDKQSKQMKKKQPTKVFNLGKNDQTAGKNASDESKTAVGNVHGKTKKKGMQEKKVISNSSNGKSPLTDKDQSSSKISILHSVKWERIILDEAHYIKDRRSGTARAVFALESSYKWALSGTPLQNRVGELYSLVRFLQISPYSYYFCKDCNCKCLDYSSTASCPSCAHNGNRHFCWWNRYIAKPIQGNAHRDEGRRAMVLLRRKLLKSIVLRRTKKGRAADLALPPRIVNLRRDTLDRKEEDYYEALYTQSRAQFDTYVSSNTLTNNYAHIFDLLTRLRQAVDHPYLVVYSRANSLSDGQKDNGGDCELCHDSAEDSVVASCEHVFCKACLIEYSAASENVTCPSCSKPLNVDLRTNSASDHSPNAKNFKRSSILSRINLNDFQTSTKIEALREEIRFMIERDGSSKGIVFSQFTSFLDLIKYSLQKSGIQCVQLVGSMSISARDDAIKKFTEDPGCKIFLMSLKAGGVALNLTVASHVFLMDPWWNPAVERQAQDRIHRIGQHKPIRIIRFIIENTVEERILRLQGKKELVFEGTVGGSSEALGRLTEADLRFLFNN